MAASPIQIQPLTSHFAAEVRGVDLSRPLAETTLKELKDAFAAHGVLFFRGQDLSPEDHVRFAESWGEINVNRFFKPVDGHPRIAEVRKEPDQTVNIGGGWHTDHSYDEIPALGSILYAREVPETGGDTLFASMTAAWDALSKGMRETLSGMRAVHSSRHIFGTGGASQSPALGGRIGNPDEATQDAVHPVGITHPLSGRKALYVNPAFTLRFEGWTAHESAPLLRFLYEHATRPEFTYRFHWEPGSIAFWDNRSTWHYALNDYQGQKRLMHRITLEGTALS
jgi:taurine dioxygenase